MGLVLLLEPLRLLPVPAPPRHGRRPGFLSCSLISNSNEDQKVTKKQCLLVGSRLLRDPPAGARAVSFISKVPGEE